MPWFAPEPVPDGEILAPHHFYIGVLIAWFAFMFVWSWYPRTGAVLALLGLGIALDDVIQHAFQVRTPLHLLWWQLLYPVIQWFEV